MPGACRRRVLPQDGADRERLPRGREALPACADRGRLVRGGGSRAGSSRMSRRSLEDLLDLAWSRLEAGVEDASAASRNLAMATVADGGPAVRTMVLRGADRGAATLEVQTDAASAKVAELAADPRAALLVWDAEASLQLRIRTRVEVVTGAAADRAWDRVPEKARSNYGGRPEPGRPMPSPEAYEPGAERARFARLLFSVEAIEALLLEDPTLRALFRREDGFGGEWLAQ